MKVTITLSNLKYPIQCDISGHEWKLSQTLFLVSLIDRFTVVAVLPGLWLETRLPVTVF